MEKILYLECNMGASGDMLMGALFELCQEKKEFLNLINGLLPDVSVSFSTTEKCGIKGTHMNVKIDGMEEHEHDHEHGHDHEHEHGHEHVHSHASYVEICNLIDSLKVAEKVKKDAKNVYLKIAKSEAEVHGRDIDNIHFHEVGTKDAVCDVVAVCYLINKINPDKIIASPICTGFGEVKCAHGVLPVPAPATALILSEAPSYQGDICGELCTPTGAALITYFAEKYGNMPIMTEKSCGYGMGTKDFDKANCLRAFLGQEYIDTENDVKQENKALNLEDEITELSCNIDDMTGEDLGFAEEILLEKGALDVFFTAIQMKKNRPGVMLTVICNKQDAEIFVKLIFKYTTTFGIRSKSCGRYILNRSSKKIETPYGEVSVKHGVGYGVVKEKAEYEDIAFCARENNISLEEVRKALNFTKKEI